MMHIKSAIRSGRRKLIKGKKVLVTGSPGVGKTTLIINLAGALKSKAPIKGFYTEEIREAGQRVGFRLTTFDGQEDWLSHVNIRSPYRVGKYKVDLAGFERLVIPLFEPSQAAPTVFIIDEIGKMECFSHGFVEGVRKVLDSPHTLVATIARKGGGFINEAKGHPMVKIFELTQANRNQIVDRILAYLEGE